MEVVQYLQLFFLLGPSSWTLAEYLQCQVSKTLSLEDAPGSTFNWTSDKVEMCSSGGLCQETVLLIKAVGTKTAVLATKSCVHNGSEAMTFIQYTSPPGLMAVSYSNYCKETLCNNKRSIAQFWTLQRSSAPSATASLHCPTCLALGSCLSAPSQPCANGTVRCYQGKLVITGGGMDSTVEVKGCTTVTGCRLLATISNVGPMTVREICKSQPLLQPRSRESSAPWKLTSIGVLELLLPLLLLSLIHFS